MNKPQNFNLYLMDGTAQGRICCTNKNWSGVAFKIPKNQIENCIDIEELNHVLIYFLFGENEVYIGIGKFKSVGNFWSDAVFFANHGNSFDSNELKFLENDFAKKILTANRYELKSESEIFSEKISAEKASDIEIFAGYIETILYFLGYKIFESPKKISDFKQNELLPKTQSETADNPVFYFERTVKGNSVIAMCQKVFSKYVVLAGSKIAPELSKKGVYKNVKAARKKAKINDDYILLEDIFFDSPSAAGSFVTGTSTQGPEVWKTKDGLTLNEYLKLEK